METNNDKDITSAHILLNHEEEGLLLISIKQSRIGLHRFYIHFKVLLFNSFIILKCHQHLHIWVQ